MYLTRWYWFKHSSGSRLAGHVFRELETLDVLECSFKCLEDHVQCKSVNYKDRKNEQYSKNCQLNDASKRTHAQDEITDENYDYYEKVFQN